MKHINLGKIENPKIKEIKKAKSGKKKEEKPPKKSKLTRTVFLSLIILVVAYGVYAFSPHIKSLWQTFFKGPAVVMSFLKNEPEELQKNDRVTNALLIGIDKRTVEPYTYLEDDEEKKNGFLSDTMIVLSYNHVTKKVSMLSIPRDLWVKIPAFNDLYEQHTKINAAYAIGDMYGYEGGGLKLITDVVAEMLDIPIHYSARVDFEGFQKIIDLMDGVNIEVEKTFDDWNYPREGYENAAMSERFLHLHFEAGLQEMDGETALQYARSRQGTNGEGSDFARAKRQQKVILGVREKALALNLFENLLKIGEWIEVLGETVETNMEMKEMLIAYKMSKEVDLQKVETYVLDTADEVSGFLYHPNEADYGGAWILLPIGNNYDLIREFVQDIFYKQEVTTPEVTGETEEQSPTENF